MRRLDLTGRKFGKLTAIKLATFRIRNRITWEFTCDCGGSLVSSVTNITNGHTRSCGCLQVEQAYKAAMLTKTHGMTHTPIYRTWRNMIGRCYEPCTNGYDNYGGRGITVCAAWRNSFEAFYADMGDRPFPKAQIDRKETNGNYEPGNCKWSTAMANANNRRNTIRLTLHGRTMGLAEWSRETGLHRDTIYDRLAKSSSVEDALTRPVRGKSI
jgi:hypothetical protein